VPFQDERFAWPTQPGAFPRSGASASRGGGAAGAAAPPSTARAASARTSAPRAVFSSHASGTSPPAAARIDATKEPRFAFSPPMTMVSRTAATSDDMLWRSMCGAVKT
jgi:hypothetical protein